MKKILTVLLAALMALSFAACKAGDGKPENTDDTSKNTQSESDTTGTSDTKAPESDNASAKDALELLTAVWDRFGEDGKFPIIGGDTNEMISDAPGAFNDESSFDSTLGIPSDQADKIEGVASMVHMMNANTFTCSAFRVKSPEDVKDVASSVKTNLMNRQWICGFPDQLVIVRTDDYLTVCFGAEDLVDAFKTNLTDAYASSEILFDEPVAA